MRVLLKFVLDTDPDAAWRALRSPAVFREVAAPLLGMTSLEDAGFPTIWQPGEHPVRVRAGGLLPIGRQLIRVSLDDRRADGVRILRDRGEGVSGALRAVTLWDHRMAVSPAPGSDDGTAKTLYRDQLTVSAGILTPAAWAGLWAFWQWRGLRLRQLAPGWSFEPELVAASASGPAGDVPALRAM
ncbi:hypothetical protein [Compostimonas suwonensis]|uniref:Carbon monoxide dehydrogenase subunit G n=1 Tax=Compostimonas suwonensis TaxID=1048394 RepID=A0A2M9C566_9MICO|nr:hypothetical protein [Compostimonas suwonensis]PJJ65673.1 hypothetical protein CLV54_0710 [Compostimonas suwonensis]